MPKIINKQIKDSKVSISPGNIKMGAIASVSLPPYDTCPHDAPCFKLCYAGKITRLRKNVKNAYNRNLKILISDDASYWNQVENAISKERFFRFHVSGDIVDMNYLVNMVGIAERQPQCNILCFTKQYAMVNEWIKRGNTIPKNLHIVFSVWKNYECPNPYKLPEAHVLFKDGMTTANELAFKCSGNCQRCANTDSGCWNLKYGEQVVFPQH